MPLDVCMVVGWDRPLLHHVLDFSEVHPIRWLAAYDTEPSKSSDWIERVADLRTASLRRVTSRYWLSLDTDVIVSADTLSKAGRWLDTRPGWGGVGIWCGAGAVPTDGRPPAMACALFLSDATEGLTFRTRSEPDSPHRNCECTNACLDIRNRGWNYDYLPDLRAIHLGG